MHPPYLFRIDPYVKPGANEIKTTVGYTAIHELSGRSQPVYWLLRDRYGDLFSPQGIDSLQPLPSGIPGPVRITSSKDPRSAGLLAIKRLSRSLQASS